MSHPHSEPRAAVRPDAADRAWRAFRRGWADVHVFVGPEFVIEWVGPSVRHVLGWSPEDLVGRNYEDFLHPDTLAENVRIGRDLHRAAAGRPVGEHRSARLFYSAAPIRFLASDGSYRPMSSRANIQLGTPDVDGVHLVLADAADAEAEDRLLERIATAASFDDIADAVVEAVRARMPGTDAAVVLAGGPVPAPGGGPVDDAVGEHVARVVRDAAPATLAVDGPGSWRSVWTLPLLGPDVDRPLGALVIWSPVAGAPATWLRPALRRLARLGAVAVRSVEERGRLHDAAHRDALTGLANRRGLDHLFRHPPRPTTGTWGVLYVDVDHFKLVNDRHGHAAGDAVLRHVAAQLTAVTRRTDLVARVGGDEFCVVCTDLRRPGDAHRLAERMRAALDAPVRADRDGPVLEVAASIGMATGAAGSDLALLAEEADVDMYRRRAARRRSVPVPFA